MAKNLRVVLLYSRNLSTMLQDPHSALLDDERLLNWLLSETVLRQEGETIYQIVEEIRALTKSARKGNFDNYDKLEQFISSIQIDEAIPVTRALTYFLTMANIAEQHHRQRRRRFHLRNPKALPQRASLEESFEKLTSSGVDKEKLYKAVINQKVELVLTAHPTEVVRRTLLQKYVKIAQALEQRDRTDLTVAEREEIVHSLRRELTEIWETDELRRQQPTPLDEARSGLLIIEQTLWDVVPEFSRSLDKILFRYTGKNLPIDSTPIMFSSWIGGDRDGNPNVTPEVTRRVVWLSQWMATRLYQKEIEKLRFELSISKCNPALRNIVGDAHEPYRAYLGLVLEKLGHTLVRVERLIIGQSDPGMPYYRSTDELISELKLIYNSLIETGNQIIADGRLSDILRRLSCFGLTLVKLDIRQESSKHTKALDAITAYLGLGNYEQWSEKERQTFLLAELQSHRPLIPQDFTSDDEVMDVINTFRMLSRIRTESLGAYVISMARSPSDVLAVLLLQKAAGRKKMIRVVPLFEMMHDLRSAGKTMETLLSIEWYRDFINGHQEVMIGYSDSSKDVGRFSAAWELYRCQEDVVSTCQRFGVSLTLFHGRGGTVGRGGGPTYLAVLSQPPGSVQGHLRVTEQGEMIQAKFGLHGIAFRTLEIYTTATMQATLNPQREPKQKWRKLIQRLANDAADGYGKVVKDNPDFVAYFKAATPESDLGSLNMSSRPVHRRKEGGLETLRAIPWIFAWTQTRVLLPVWLGFGESLSQSIEAGELPQLREMYQEWYFFRSTVDLMEMVLSKTDHYIALQYDKKLVPENLKYIGEDIQNRLKVAFEVSKQVTEHRQILEENQVLARSIEVRNPHLDALNMMQIELLRRLRQNSSEDDLKRALLLTINGISAGMRNTG